MLVLIPMSLLLSGFRANLGECLSPVPSDLDFHAPAGVPPAGDGPTILHAEANFSKYSTRMYRIGN
jgi:hypothetical protein